MDNHIREIDKEFFNRDALLVAPELLGRLLIYNGGGQALAGVITETEAYGGPHDKAAHSYRGQTKRNTPMFGPYGVLYVYQIYGMYNCLNIVTSREGDAQAVLIRALEPVSGIDIMEKNSGIQGFCKNHQQNIFKPYLYRLTCGPGKLCRAFGIDKRHNNIPLQNPGIYVSGQYYYNDFEISASPRINVQYAEEASLLPWRFFIKGSPYVSKHSFNKIATDYKKIPPQ